MIDIIEVARVGKWNKRITTFYKTEEVLEGLRGMGSIIIYRPDINETCRNHLFSTISKILFQDCKVLVGSRKAVFLFCLLTSGIGKFSFGLFSLVLVVQLFGIWLCLIFSQKSIYMIAYQLDSIPSALFKRAYFILYS